MAATKTYNGYTYEQQPDGSWKRGAPVSQMPADPTFPYKGQQAGADLGKTQATTTGQVLDNRVTEATLPAVVKKTNADAVTAERGASTAGLPEGFMWAPDGKNAVPIPGYTRQGLSPEIRSQSLQAFSDADALERAATELEELYKTGPGATKGIWGLGDYLPSDSNRVFNDAGQQARGYVKRSLGFTGGEGNTVAESSALYDPYLPSASDRDVQIEAKIKKLRGLANDARAKATRTLGGVPDASGNIQPLPNALTATRTVGGDPLQAAAFGATTGVDQYPPEMLQAHEALVGRLLMQGGGKLDPQVYASERAKLNQQFQFSGDTQSDIAWAQGINDYLAKGGKSVPTDIKPPERELTPGEFLHHSAVNNPVGAALVGAGDAGSFGAVSALSGDDVRALGDQGGWTGAGLTLGQIAGSVYGAGNAGKLAGWATGKVLPSQVSARLLQGGGRLGNFGREMGADALYSGAIGVAQGEDPLTAAAFGASGSLAGRVAGKVGGGIAGGVAESAPVQALKARGIPMTVGQRLGGFAKSVEDKATSIPLVGDIINARRLDGLQAFNRAAFDDAGRPIGFTPKDIGKEGVSELFQEVGNAYDSATAGVRVPLDDQFMADIAKARAAGQQLPPDLQVRYDQALANRVDPLIPPPDTRIVYRGTNGSSERIRGGIGEGHLFAAANEAGARLYGDNIEKIGIPPSARVLSEGTPDFRSISGRRGNTLFRNLRAGESLKDGADDVINRAQAAGVDAVEFDGDLGIAILNPGAVRRDFSTDLSGEQYQQAVRGLKSYRAETTKPGFEQDYREALGLPINALRGLMERGGGQRVVQGLGRADTAYRSAKTIEDAVGRAKGGSMSGELYTFTPSQLQGAVAKTNGKFPGAHPLEALANDGQAVLPSRVPDSGTAGRLANMAMGSGTIGAGAGLGALFGGGEGAQDGALYSALMTGALLAGGTKGGQKALGKMIFDRPQALKTTGAFLNTRKGLFGRAMIPLVLPDSYQP